MRTTNENLDKFTDTFIVEMGAFRIGAIKILCDFVKPKYGIITTIGTAHLETFGSRENICKGKFELIEWNGIKHKCSFKCLNCGKI